jgi:hypothetical protein
MPSSAAMSFSAVKLKVRPAALPERAPSPNEIDAVLENEPTAVVLMIDVGTTLPAAAVVEIVMEA